MTGRTSLHPPLGSRTPSRTEDFFDADQLAELRAYARPAKRVRLGSRIVTGAIELILIFGLDLGPTVAGWADGWAMQLIVVGAVFTAITMALDLPAGYWLTMVHDRRHGLSNQSLGLWIVDQIRELLLSALLIAAFLVPVYAVVRNVGAWWLIGGLVFVALSIVMAFVYPVLIMPRFNTFTPMPDGDLRRRITDIAALAGTTIEGVYTMDGSKRSVRGNAFVAGFGPTKRVVVFDTILDFPLDEIAQIVAHEIGHYRLHHIPKTFPFTALQLLAALAFVQYIGGNDTVLGWAGVDDLGDPGALPVFLLAFGIPTVATGLGTSWLSRRNEREADLEALDLLGQPTEFVAMWPRLVERNKADLEPGWWQRLNASHPEVAERMQFGLDWAAMNDRPVEPPEVGVVPDLAAVASGDAHGAMG